MKAPYLKHTMVATFLISIIPFVWIWVMAGFSYPRVPIEIADDSLYYFGRAVEVSQGHIFIGNQYSVEHRDDPTVAFFVADWIWSIPLLLGASLPVAIIINQVLYFLIVGYLLHIILSRMRVRPQYVPAGVVCILFFVYWFLARPVAMQVVFPLFLLWIISLYYFIHNPTNRKAQIALGLVSVGSVYVYTYLTQIIVVSLSIGLCAIVSKKFRIYKTALFPLMGASTLSIPFLLYTWKQIHHPFYFETLARIGLVETHLIGFAAVLYVCIILLCAGMVWVQRAEYSREELSVFVLVSAGLLIATVSNVISGKDLEVAVHIGRFVELWSGIVFVIILAHTKVLHQRKMMYVMLGVMSLCLVYIGLTQVRVWRSIGMHTLADQRYAPVLAWLREHTPADSVVFTDDHLASYIPVETNDYVLFSPNTLLYLASDTEIEQRYVLSRVFTDLSLKDIQHDMRKYAGAGHTAHRYKVHNRAVRLCRFVMVGSWNNRCREYTDQYALKGESYFGRFEVQHLYMKEDYRNELKKFNVSYVVVDRENDSWKIPNDLTLLWSDNIFYIYKID